MFNFYKNLFKMAKRKKTRRRSKGLHAGALMARGRRTKRITRKKRGGLSEAFSPATATATAKTMGGAALGGFGYGFVKPAIESATENKLYQNGILLGLSFLSSAVLKMDAVSAGIAGAWGYDMSRNMQGLAEMQDHEYSSTDLMDEPEYLDEMGEPMYLAADGNFYYMDEMQEMQEDDDDLSEPVYLADSNFYPEYVNTSNY